MLAPSGLCYAARTSQGLTFTRSAATVRGTSGTPWFGLSYTVSGTLSLWELQTFKVLVVDSDRKAEGVLEMYKEA